MPIGTKYGHLAKIQKNSEIDQMSYVVMIASEIRNKQCNNAEQDANRQVSCIFYPYETLEPERRLFLVSTEKENHSDEKNN